MSNPKQALLPDAGSPKNEGNNKKPPKSILTLVLIFFVVPVMAFWEGFRALHKRVYETGHFGPFRLLLGVVTGLAAGIAVGYFHGYQAGWSWYSWLSAGIATTLLTYAYAWPLAWLYGLRPFRVVSKELWDAIPDHKHWFNVFIRRCSHVAVVGAAGYVGWTQALVAFANLTENHWGIFAYPGAIAWFGFVTVVTASIAWSVFTTSVKGICAGTGLAFTYALHPMTQLTVAHYGIAYPGVVEVVSTVEFLFYVAFLFPFAHLLGSHGLRFLKDGLQGLLKRAYETKVGVYEDVFVQIVNIWTAGHLASLTVALVASLGYTPIGWIAYAIPAVVALLSYMVVGQIYRDIGNRGLGVVAAAHGVRYAVLALQSTGADVGWLIAGGALAAFATYFVVYPLAYVSVRLFAQFVLNNSIAARLVTLHTKVCTAFDDLLEEIRRARKNTYGDSSWFSTMFLHVVNLAALLPVWYFTSSFLVGIGTTGALAISLTTLALITSYLLLGQLLLLGDNYLVGAAVSLAGAVAIGICSFATLPYGLWVAVTLAVISSIVIARWLFPIAYVLTKFIVNLTDGLVPLFSKAVEPILRRVYNFCWDKAAGLWERFLETYEMVRDAIKPTMQTIRSAWKDAWQSVKDAWDSIKRN